MADIFSYDFQDFDGQNGKISICSGPVIFNDEGEVLLHVSTSTKKYQFIWWRLDDSKSLRENLIARSAKVLWHSDITIVNDSPLCLLGDIEREWKKEKVLLYHYKCSLNSSHDIWDAEWKTFSELKELAKQDMLSSPNILIAVEHFS